MTDNPQKQEASMVQAPANAGKRQAVRDKKGRFPKGISGNPIGKTGVKGLTAQQFIDSMYRTQGKTATDKIFRMAMTLAKQGDVSLLCKILDKILPSKVEQKTDLTITHREEFLRMRNKAMDILQRIGAELN